MGKLQQSVPIDRVQHNYETMSITKDDFVLEEVYLSHILQLVVYPIQVVSTLSLYYLCNEPPFVMLTDN